MNQFVTLHGAEQVASAGHNMEHAAQKMSAAASDISFALQQHQQFMWEWLTAFQEALKAAKGAE